MILISNAMIILFEKFFYAFRNYIYTSILMTFIIQIRPD